MINRIGPKNMEKIKPPITTVWLNFVSGITGALYIVINSGNSDFNSSTCSPIIARRETNPMAKILVRADIASAAPICILKMRRTRINSKPWMENRGDNPNKNPNVSPAAICPAPFSECKSFIDEMTCPMIYDKFAPRIVKELF